MNQPAEQPQVQYVGFWARVLAALIDTLALGLLMIIVGRILGFPHADYMGPNGSPLLSPEYWSEVGTNQILSAAVVIAFWSWKMATPGKMVINAMIVDEKTLGRPTTGQLIGRYLGYFLSTFFFGLGLIWVAFDARKQGWHDKLAGTLVIKKHP